MNTAPNAVRPADFSVSTDFDMSQPIQAVLGDTTLSSITQLPEDNSLSITQSATPFSDFVYNLTTGTPSVPPDIPTGEAEHKPVVPEKHSTLGIKIPTDLPEIVTSEGVHIYAADKALADRFAAIVKRYPRMWKDEGQIVQDKDELMRIPLVEGWQHQKIRSRQYPLSARDREVLDATFDKLHHQGRLGWATKATPFAHPVFVVWRTARGKTKGRVVIDLRTLNKVTVPDNYPLPLQSDIISCLRGKQFITAIDATSFFYQFDVYPEHRDRFTLISPRGLEQPKVCLMGYRNTPAYVQRYMDQLLRPHASFARAFIDDIIIFGDDAEDHLQQLDTIFRLFSEKNISIAPAKSYVGYPSVELLGFYVNGFGLTTTEHRIEAFRNLAFPANLKALEQYIGASGFLRHLIPYYAKLIEPLQHRKTALLAQGRKDGRIETGNPGKRAAYCSRTTFEPTAAEKASFEAI
jgi:hypothetical protein